MIITTKGNYFWDFKIGQTFVSPVPRRLTAADASLYIAYTGDRTPRFCRDDLIHPLIVFHCVFGQTVRDISFNARANLGYAECVWHRPVMVGDVLTAETEVIGLKENSSGTTGIVWVHTVGKRQDGAPVVSWVRWVMVYKEDRDHVTDFRENPVIPELASHVPAEQLVVPRGVPLPVYGQRFWEDYNEGGRLNHRDGHVITDADHMQFTRLFQNSAGVHFNPNLGGSERRTLVYGGYPISVGYAHAANGLDNRLGIAAINSGKHVAPVYAGDVLMTDTVVLEKAELSDPSVGALRCQMLVDKHPGTGRERILELDYWEIVTRRPA